MYMQILAIRSAKTEDDVSDDHDHHRDPSRPAQTSDTRRFLFLLGSGRPHGNSEILARRAAARLPLDVPCRWLRLSDVPLADFTDTRTVTGTDRRPAGYEWLLLAATLEATDIVLVTPVYWYTVSAITKRYLDQWFEWQRAPEVDFTTRMRGKTLWAISATGDRRPTSSAATMVDMLRNTAGDLCMRWGGALLGTGDRPGDVLTDTDAVAGVAGLFRRYAHSGTDGTVSFAG